jgi:hypothetical protein
MYLKYSVLLCEFLKLNAIKKLLFYYCYYWKIFIREQDYYKLESNTCRTTRDFSLQFKHIQAESSESRYQ